MTSSPESSAPPGDSPAIAAAAAALVEARRSGTILASLEPAAPTTVAEGYAIADAVAAQLEQPVVGWKIGCTSEFAQQALKSDGPISGRVHDLRRSEGGEPVRLDSVVEGGQLEGEFAFTLSTDLDPAQAPFSRDDIAAAVSTLHPAIEIVGGRCEAFLASPVESIIADSGGNTCLVIGDPAEGWEVDDLPAAGASMTVDGAVTGSGTGADVLGHPLDAVVWLANHLAERSIGLKAGEVITSGTCTQVTPATPGAIATVDFGPYGSVSLQL